MLPFFEKHYPELRRAALERLRHFESFDRDQLDSWQLDQLNNMLKYCGDHSPFYRRRFTDWGAFQFLTELDDMRQLEFTLKEDLRSQYPFGFLAVPKSEIIRYGESTGTTGPPSSSFITFEDWATGNVRVVKALEPFFAPGDMVFIAIPYELGFASYDVDRALEDLGVAVVAVGTLNKICPFERVVEMMHVLHPTGLVCTPTRALRLNDMLVEKGYDPLEVGLKTLLYVGETCSAAKLGKIAELWNIRLTTAYGSTETNALALPCSEGRLHLTEDRHYFEVVHPETGERVPKGDMGELVLTSLLSKAMPLVRYRTGDLVCIEPEPCACGSALHVLSHLGRLNERLFIDGRPIYRIQLEELILSTPQTGIYYVIDIRDGELRIFVELVEGASVEVCENIKQRVRDAYGVPVSVRAVAKELITQAMDRMLKPGSVNIDQIAELR